MIFADDIKRSMEIPEVRASVDLELQGTVLESANLCLSGRPIAGITNKGKLVLYKINDPFLKKILCLDPEGHIEIIENCHTP